MEYRMAIVSHTARPLLDCRPAASDLVRIVLDHWHALPIALACNRTCTAAPLARLLACTAWPALFGAHFIIETNVTAAIFSRVLASLTLLERQAAHRLQKSSSSRRLAMVSSTDTTVPLAVALWTSCALVVWYSFLAASAHAICSSLIFGTSLAAIALAGDIASNSAIALA